MDLTQAQVPVDRVLQKMKEQIAELSMRVITLEAILESVDVPNPPAEDRVEPPLQPEVVNPEVVTKQ